ncbi:MAG: acyl-CoA dehydrogenase [Bauldia sp.]|nr:acyl-CoA dehydrogenase [Bauldia sp.]
MNQITSAVAADEPVTPGSPRLEPLYALIAEGSAARDRERIHPYAEIDLIRAARLGAIRLPKEAGGGGASFRQLFEIVIRLGEADSNVAHILRNHFAFVERFAQDTPDEKHLRWQRAVASGAIVGLANTELDRVKNGRESATILRREGEGYRMTGTKYYSTGCLYADLIIVRAKDESGSQVSVVIPADREGVSLLDDWDGAGQRLTGTGTTLLDNVRVEADEVVFDSAGANYQLPHPSTLPQLLLTAINAGILRAILRDAKALVGKRRKGFHHAPSEKPADDPLNQLIVGTMSVQAFAAESVVLAAADAQDRLYEARKGGGPEPELAQAGALLAAKAKVLVDELVQKAGGAIFDIGGASSTERSYNLDRHWRNARTIASHNPAHLKARVIGDLEINGKQLPSASFF